DAKEGKLIEKGVAAKVQNPTYLTISKNKEYLYSVAQEDEQGGVYAYKLNPDSHSLKQTDSQLEAGAPPCYVEVAGNTLTTANYHKGSVGLLDRKSTRLNSSHVSISYAVFCLKKKNNNIEEYAYTV